MTRADLEKLAEEYAKATDHDSAEQGWEGARAEVFSNQQDTAQHKLGAVMNAECFLKAAFIAGAMAMREAAAKALERLAAPVIEPTSESRLLLECAEIARALGEEDGKHD